MKILIIGPLGAGKSSLAYAINKKYKLPRLNLDEICRRPADGSYYPREEQFAKLDSFLQKHSDWVAEGCQRYLYEKMTPDLIVDMRINRLVAMWRFTLRFIIRPLQSEYSARISARVKLLQVLRFFAQARIENRQLEFSVNSSKSPPASGSVQFCNNHSG